MFRRLWNKVKSFFRAVRRPDSAITASTTTGAAIGRTFAYTVGTVAAISVGAIPVAVAIVSVGILDLWFHLWAGYHLAIHSLMTQPIRVT